MNCASFNLFFLKQLPASSIFEPRSVYVFLGGGCTEVALACKLRQHYRTASDENLVRASNLLAKALEGNKNKQI